MRRALFVLGLACLVAMLGACSSSSTDTNPQDQVGPLLINLLAATPETGPGPLRVTFTANITGGLAPYFYSWDFTNDGSVDLYLNNEFRRTVSVQHDFYLRATDAGGTSEYVAVLSVMDSEGTVLTQNSDPLSVSGSDLTIDISQTKVTSDQVDAHGYFIYDTNKPCYFAALPSGGTPHPARNAGEKPYYDYQWDFNNDGIVDSTLEKPQFTYTNATPFARLFHPRLIIVDAKGVHFEYMFTTEEYDVTTGSFKTIPGVLVQPDPEIAAQEPPPAEFVIILDTSPAESNGVITLRFDPTGSNDSVPLEPQLDMAVVVSPNPAERGVPPYEYYWDFQNDGAFESQVLSPTVPYYDDARKITVNPYMTQLARKDFTLRVMVIDSAGQVREITRTVVAVNLSGGAVDLLDVQTTYGIIGPGGAFVAPPPATPPVPYGLVTTPDATTEVRFSFTIAGSTGVYEYQLDANGDGTPEVPAAPGWEPVTTAAGVEISQTIPYLGIGYFPAKLSVRSKGAGDVVADSTTVEMPVSLVARNKITLSEGSIKKRYDHGVAASWVVQPGGGNGQYLASRELVIAGGAQGSTPIRDVERIVQSFNAPGGPGLPEQQSAFAGLTRLPLVQERRGFMMWAFNPSTANPMCFVHGGNNLINGILAFNEASPGAAAGAGSAWTILSETHIPAWYPLKDACGTYVTGEGFLFTGGLHPPSASDVDNVNGKLLVYVPPPTLPPPLGTDVYGEYGPTMMTDRYDASAAYINNRLYIIGGRVASGQSVATVEAYNFNTNQWELAPSLQEARSGAVCGVIGGRIYVVGGAYYPNDYSLSTLLQTAEVFNPNNGKWSYTLPLAAGEAVNSAAGATTPGPLSVNAGGATINTLWSIGGEDAGGESNRIIEFNYLYTVTPPPPAP